MKTFISAQLKKNPLTKEPNDFYAQVILNGKYGVSEIIDELLKDNKEISKKNALELINSFNQKVVELLATGSQVNTNLLTLSPIIKGPFINKKWNPTLNKVDVNISYGYELSKALIDTKIQVIEEQANASEIIDKSQRISEKKTISKNIIDSNNLTLKSNPEPPCGMAFRKWLCNS
ncbi:MAG: DNA-binding domain-containing protein [Bacteroidota bacterium]|jgi:DNA-binding domain